MISLARNSVRPLSHCLTRQPSRAPLFCAGIGYRRADCKCGLDVNFPQDANNENLLSTLLSMTAIDSAEADRRLGVCPIPLYDFSEADYELLLSGKDIDELQAQLKALGIYQYFFPAPDQLLLGLADNRVTEDGSLVLAAEEAPTHGHLLGAPELFQDNATLLETLEELKGAGYVADAEFGVEITDKGRAVRQNIKIRPRESLISKIAKIISVKLDISAKDIFK